MKLATCALMGGNREAVSQEMLRSASTITDFFVLMNTGESADKACEQACNEFPDAYVSIWSPQGQELCVSGRNQCLRDAQILGADWALLLDTDERLHWRAELNIRATLESTDADIVLVRDDKGNYRKTKFFRLPAKGQWQTEQTDPPGGGSHEYFKQDEGSIVKVLHGCWFTELERDEDEQAKRMAAIEANCRDQVRTNPKSARSWYYLGEALGYNGKPDEALFALFNCYGCSDWQSEQDWCLYLAANIRMNQGQFRAAIEYCRLGGLAQPSWPEFPWLAAVCAAKGGAFEQAVAFADEAEALGPEQRANECQRDFFVNRLAWFEGPAGVSRVAHANLGHVAAALAASERYDALKEQRSTL